MTVKPALTKFLTESGVWDTLFSPGYTSFNTPIVNSEYGMGLPKIFVVVPAFKISFFGVVVEETSSCWSSASALLAGGSTTLAYRGGTITDECRLLGPSYGNDGWKGAYERELRGVLPLLVVTTTDDNVPVGTHAYPSCTSSSSTVIATRRGDEAKEWLGRTIFMMDVLCEDVRERGCVMNWIFPTNQYPFRF